MVHNHWYRMFATAVNGVGVAGSQACYSTWLMIDSTPPVAEAAYIVRALKDAPNATECRDCSAARAFGVSRHTRPWKTRQLMRQADLESAQNDHFQDRWAFRLSERGAGAHP